MHAMIRKLAVQRLARSLNLPLGILNILEGLSEQVLLLVLDDRHPSFPLVIPVDAFHSAGV